MKSEGPDTPDLKRSRRVRQSSIAPERLPPYSVEAEQGILGCIMLDNALVGRCIEAFKREQQPFYDLRNQTIYDSMVTMYEDREAIDPITLQERLKAFEQLESVGGLQYIGSLADAVPSAQNLDYYIEIVRDMWLRRKMISTATEVVTRMYSLEGEDLETVLDMAERDILRVSESRVQSATKTIRELVKEAIYDIEMSAGRGGTISGLSTGFNDFDRLTDGLHPGEFLLIAARPGIGKTSLALNIVDNIAVEQRIPVGVFSLEMTNKELVKRLLSSRARVNLRNVRAGFISKEDTKKITDNSGKISGAPIFIDDQGGLSILELRAKARRMFQQYNIKLFVIDYLQLLNALGGKRKFESRQQEVADISVGIKNLAKELSVPIIALSQLSRNIERENNRRPRLSDLRESGAQEADADVVTFLYARPGADGEDISQDQDRVAVNWMIGKQRNGPTGDVPLIFLREFTRFESSARVSDEDIPVEAIAEQQQMPV